MLDVQDSIVTGAAFEDMSIAEMTRVQGGGDISPETTPACLLIISNVISGAAVSYKFSVDVVKTLKGKC